jgi:hypothetical protein
VRGPARTAHILLDHPGDCHGSDALFDPPAATSASGRCSQSFLRWRILREEVAEA